MRRYDFGYFFREGLRGVFLHGFMSFAAVGVIVACLLIMGSVSLLAVNVDHMIAQVESQNEVVAYIDESYSDAEARSVSTAINKLENVTDCIFVHRDEALESYLETLGPDSAYLEGLEEDNPLRHRYRIMLADLSLIEDTVRELRVIPGVARVNARVDISESVLEIRRTVETISLILVVVLMLVSAFIISNTVKLATFDRKEEIAIMRMVGATNGFIRWPFLVEGFLLGMLGSVVAFFLQWGIYNGVAGGLVESASAGDSLFSALPYSDLFLTILLTFLAAGFSVGVVGSLLTIRKYLKV